MMTIVFIQLLFIPPSEAWNRHEGVMERLLETQAAKSLPLSLKIEVPSSHDEKNELEKLSYDLEINGDQVPLFGKKKPSVVQLQDLLKSKMIDEPDFGMDQNLPESVDPHHFRAWMGGVSGPTSQGFRHMLFNGIEWTSPLATFQIPTHSIGNALERIEKIRAISNRYFAEKNFFWGYRTLLWELHYIQDLQQPFHVIQAPSLKMLPWKKLFSGFVKASTHSIANYHYAYEGLIEELLTHPDEATQKCFDVTQKKVFLKPVELIKTPRSLASDLGSALFRIFGNRMKSDEVNLPEGIGGVDYFEILNAADIHPDADELKTLTSSEKAALQYQNKMFESLKEVKAHTCKLMQELSEWTLGELMRPTDLVLQSNSIKTGK